MDTTISQKDKIWLSARNILRKKLNEDIFTRWFSSIKVVAYANNEFVLGVSDDFFADWLEEHGLPAPTLEGVSTYEEN